MFYRVSSAGILAGALMALPAHAAPVLADFGLYAATGPVVIGQNAEITGGLIGSGGAIKIGNNSETKGMYAGGNVTIGNNSAVDGTITAGGTINLGNNATALGQSPSTPFAGVALPGAVVPTGANGANVNSGGNLAAGTYGSLSLGNNATLNLSAGDYLFSSVLFGNGAKLNFDLSGGAINVYVDGNAGFGNNSIWNLTGGDASKVLWEIGGDFSTSGNNASIAGTIYTSGLANIALDNIDLDNNVSLIGALYSTGGIEIGNNFNFTHLAYDWPATVATVAPVPLPAAFPLLLGAVGLLSAMAHRRRKTSA